VCIRTPYMSQKRAECLCCLGVFRHVGYPNLLSFLLHDLRVYLHSARHTQEAQALRERVACKNTEVHLTYVFSHIMCVFLHPTFCATCSLPRCVAVCCSVLQCVAVRHIQPYLLCDIYVLTYHVCILTPYLSHRRGVGLPREVCGS